MNWQFVAPCRELIDSSWPRRARVPMFGRMTIRRVKARNRPVNASWPKEVAIFEVLGHTAAAKVTA